MFKSCLISCLLELLQCSVAGWSAVNTPACYRTTATGRSVRYCRVTVLGVQDREYKKLWGRVNSDEYLQLLDESKEVCIPKKESNKSDTPDDGGLYPIDILDPSLYVRS